MVLKVMDVDRRHVMLPSAIFVPLSSVRRLERTRARRLRPLGVTHRLYSGILVIKTVSRHNSTGRRCRERFGGWIGGVEQVRNGRERQISGCRGRHDEVNIEQR